MNKDIEDMIQIYETYEVDWMADPFKSPHELTRHHIVKQENGGENGISNYALLTKNSHILLHYMEDNYVNEYNELNSLFLSLNRSLCPPSIGYYEEVKRIIKRVKKQIKNKRRTIGKR